MLLSDIIYHLEITDNIDYLELSVSDCLKASSHLINNLQDNHQIPGNVYYQFIGILDWYREHQFITEKQHSWLKYNLWQYIGERNPLFD